LIFAKYRAEFDEFIPENKSNSEGTLKTMADVKTGDKHLQNFKRLCKHNLPKLTRKIH
jgi:hypothetical protein